jgi:hypothetical protein
MAAKRYEVTPNKPGSGHVGFVMDKVALGQVFSEYFCFPCQSSFHQSPPSIIWGWYNRPVLAAVPSGLSLTPLTIIIIIIIIQ